MVEGTGDGVVDAGTGVGKARHQPHGVLVVGHSGGVVAPDAAEVPSAHGGSADAVLKPATEPDGSDVTEPDGSDVTEPDGSDVVGRRRAVALAGHRHDEATARSGLTDPAGRFGPPHSEPSNDSAPFPTRRWRHALADPAPAVRRRACELAATRSSVAIEVLLHDADDSVVEMTAWSLGERGERSAVAALSALAALGSGHRDPLCREAAVAALGAIGDASGLPAVLAALEDKPAMRRRAAVALAAFDGPPVEAALRRCLEDRDWQVRQVAEDLLAVE